MVDVIVIVDNRDSYTFNLAQLFAVVSGTEPLGVPADEVFAQRLPARLAAGEFSHLVISPGPGTPAEHGDFAGSRAALEAAGDVPTLGVCLGHQGLGMFAGATVDRAPRARHGFVSRVAHSGAGIFRDVPQEFAVVRYHSLHVRDVDEVSLRIHARAEDGVIMGLEVRDRPHWGVQFHPESILTEHGATLVRNFLDLARVQVPQRADLQAAGQRSTGQWTRGQQLAGQQFAGHQGPAPRRRRARAASALPRPQVTVETIEREIDCAATFAHVDAGATAAFWLDSASRVSDSGRYSVLGTNEGSRARTVRSRVGGATEIQTGDRTEVLEQDILTFLEDALAETAGDWPDIPFTDGFFGYLGYECRTLTTPGKPSRFRSEQPDAYFVEPQAHIVVDHDLGHTHLVVREGEDADQLRQQLREALRFEAPSAAPTGQADPAERADAVDLPGTVERPSTVDRPVSAERAVPATRQVSGGHRTPTPRGRWRLTDTEYASRITDITAALLRGDSYEVCLTDAYEVTAEVDGLTLYRELRGQSRAPYAGYFRFNTFGDNLEVLSASPERFLRVTADRTVESKPIKGTARRSADPGEDIGLANALRDDPKTRAENLMIVDLLRNDLGRVCEVGSVAVPSLMQIESYSNVHQLVSTIRGRLRADHSLVDLLRATFPGGSMTGAPKARTLEIIDALEAGPRGIYSGTLGYLGHDGTADLNIVIRTIVKAGSKMQIGAGGAIVLDSDVAAEIEEKNLKAAALVRAIGRVAAHATADDSEAHNDR
ncbi:aminodeoxychorismate synthase component I [Gulosibacter molinativorax]|uniref:aminodeoxychorismate synthase component I n=1 Tax=Gulosibacter molinativorax TaxID=256821 RepID=UPI000425D789|nr:aminodeoxychorismate synthase component I [Gulosibacter molinativorax]QUY63886.1 Aminodeoxychorismate synthase, component I [Gulosibacter molinativorax]